MKLKNRKIISKPEKVYNLHIKNDHNYVVNGAVVKNCHTLTGKNLKEMMSSAPLSQVPFRWGLTGTVPKEPHEYNALLVSVGPQSGNIDAVELQDKGILSNCNIQVLQTVDDVDYKTWDQEIQYLTMDQKRIDWMVDKITEISQNGNTLVLVGRTETGKKISAALGVPYIYGNVSGKKRKEEYVSLNKGSNQITVASFGVASTGISINRIFNLVLIEAGKSYTKTIQSVGRGLRVAQDKDHVEIYDFCSTAKFSKRHLTQRKEFYKEAQYPFTITKVKYR